MVIPSLSSTTADLRPNEYKASNIHQSQRIGTMPAPTLATSSYPAKATFVVLRKFVGIQVSAKPDRFTGLQTAVLSCH